MLDQMGERELDHHLMRETLCENFEIDSERTDSPTSRSNGSLVERFRAHTSGLPRMIFATLLLSVGTGIIGIFLASLTANVQHFAFGPQHQNFPGILGCVVSTGHLQRFVAVVAAGWLGASAWFWLRGLKQPVISVKDALKGKRMPPLVTLCNSITQNVVGALGGSFGIEAAPREIASMLGGWLSEMLVLPPEQRTALIACGSGGGLAAVYFVPISGVLFTLEHVLDWKDWQFTLLPAVVVSCVSSLISCGYYTPWLTSVPFLHTVETIGLYPMLKEDFTFHKSSNQWPSISLLLWSLLIGPIVGVTATSFNAIMTFAADLRPSGRYLADFHNPPRSIWLASPQPNERWRIATVRDSCSNHVVVDLGDEVETWNATQWATNAPKGRRNVTILVVMPAAFIFLGVLSLHYPFLLGNGRALAETAIHPSYRNEIFHGANQTYAFNDLWSCLFLKPLVTSMAVASGAVGGTLTPSVAIGATLGTLIADTLWIPSWPFPNQHELEAMAIISAAAFLATTMRAPLTGIWIMVEFSAQAVDWTVLRRCLRGDLHGLLESKLAIGMLLPMGIAVFGACHVSRLMEGKKNVARRQDLPCRSNARRVQFELDDCTKDGCFTCFRIGILFNMFITICMAAAQDDHNSVVMASFAGVILSAVIGVISWFRIARQVREHSSSSFLNAELLNELPAENESAMRVRIGTDLGSGAIVVAVCSVAGALAPFLPWLLCTGYAMQQITLKGESHWISEPFHLSYPATTLIVTVAFAQSSIALVAQADAQYPKVGFIREHAHRGLRWYKIIRDHCFCLLAAVVAFLLGTILRVLWAARPQ